MYRISKVPVSEYANYKLSRRIACAKVELAIRKRQLTNLKKKRIPCTDCKKRRAIGYDHRDYSLPLNVEPVCGSCNIKRGAAYAWVVL